jgi:hypothetical protein
LLIQGYMRKDGGNSETMVKTRAARRGRPIPRLPDLFFGTRFVYAYGSLRFSTSLLGYPKMRKQEQRWVKRVAAGEDSRLR